MMLQMISRERSESWTFGAKLQNQYIQQIHPSSSDSKLLNRVFPINKQDDIFVKSKKNLHSSQSLSEQNDCNFSFLKPGFSTSSLESINLKDTVPISQSETNNGKSISIKGHLNNSTAVTMSVPSDYEQKSSKSLSKNLPDKFTFGALLNWLSPSKKINNKQNEYSTNHHTNAAKNNQSVKMKLKTESSQKLAFPINHSSSSLDCLDSRVSQFKDLELSVRSSLSLPMNGIRRNHSFEPLSTTALILENRPSNLPSKSREEFQRHQLQYQKMIENVKKQEIKDMLKKRKHLKEQAKHEQLVSAASLLWTNEILPNWNTMQYSTRTRELWWQGLPSNVRGIVWQMAIGNDLNMTKDLYELMAARAQARLRQMAENHNYKDEESTTTAVDRESTVNSIRLDISRTFPHLGVFQQGAPYYDIMHDILGAYACYRPDVGYVQGMSFMAAMLLLNMEPEDAFVTFANLLNKPCQVAFYRLDQKQMKTYFVTFEVFFERNLPKLFSRFKKLKLTPDMYLIDWVFTIFSKALNLDIASRVWDVFCRDGEEFLFRTAIAILKMNENILLDLDFISTAQFLTKLSSQFSHQELFDHIADVIMVSRNNRRWKEVFNLVKDMR